MKQKNPLIKLITAMFIFGTIGIFRRGIPLPSGMIAFIRGVIGSIGLVLLLMLRGRKMDKAAVKKHLAVLLLSGVCVGFNWVLLFEAYRYTTVSVATVCYYMAPVFAAAAAPFIFGDRLTLKKMLCIAAACIGLILTSGILDTGISGMKGIAFGLGAAALYAAIILLNRLLTEVPGYDKTIIQLAAAAVAVGVYSFTAEDFSEAVFNGQTIALLIIVGVVHTGFAYALYFESVGELPTQTAAIFSYIDPVVSILLAALLLDEPLTFVPACGIVMVLGSTILSELEIPKKQLKE